MQIIDFNVYSDDCLNIFFILLSICLIVFTLKNFLDYLYDSYLEEKYCKDLFDKTESARKEVNKFVLRLTLISILLCLLPLLKISQISQISKKSPKILMIKYINNNINGNAINISKEQIINDILNGKITENKNNLTLYTQAIPITEEEYKKLSKYKKERDKSIENGNVNIIN